MLALREVSRRKLQFGLIAAVVTLVAYLVIMVTGLGLGLNEHAGTALLSLRGRALAYSDGSDLSVIRSEVGQETVAEIAATDGVGAHAVLGYVAAALQNGDGEVTTAGLLGYEPGSIGEPLVVEGRAPAPGETRALLADRRFLEEAGLEVGDTVQVPIRLRLVDFEIVGAIDEGTFFFQPVVYLPLDAWREVRYGVLDEFTPVGSVVLLEGEGLDGLSGNGWVAVDKQTAFRNIEGVQEQQSTVDALRYVGLLIGGMVVGIFFYVLTLQKISQLGMLKAIGAPGGYLVRQGLIQVLLITLIASAVAVAMAVGTEALISGSGSGVPIRFTPASLLTTGALIVAAGVVGSLLSARQIARIDPIIALAQQP